MKRIGVILLLGLFSFLLIAPVGLARDPEPQLPACCRAHGKHHCALPTGDAPAAPLFQASHHRCPFFPGAGAVGSYQQTLTPAAAQPFFANVASHPAAGLQAEALYRISYNRTRQKRGPPAIRS